MKVDFLTAKLAKEKGFSLGSSNVWFLYEDGVIEECSNFYTLNNCDESDLSNSKFTVYERPTQEDLQKWLRDEQIFIEIGVDQTTEPKFCYSINKFIGNPRDLAEREWGWEKVEISDWGLYRKWEEALEDGLVEALKTIK